MSSNITSKSYANPSTLASINVRNLDVKMPCGENKHQNIVLAQTVLLKNII